MPLQPLYCPIRTDPSTNLKEPDRFLTSDKNRNDSKPLDQPLRDNVSL